MNKLWRTVMTIALILVAAGIVLLGAAWVTGASIPRIIEMVFGGRDELNAWFSAGLDRVRTLWAGALDQIRAFF